jgi:hypothetical protein
MFDGFYTRKWAIKKVQRFRSQLFAYRYVIIPAASNKRKFARLTPASIRRRLWRAHVLWFRRIKELACRELWFPSPRYSSLFVKSASVKRCLYCRPTNLVYRWADGEPNLKLCGRTSSCPFCAARHAEDLYKRVSRSIRDLSKRGIPAVAVVRVSNYFVSAKAFEDVGWDVANMYKNAGVLREILQTEKAKYKQIRRQLQRRTYGSLWRVVVNPVDAGWEIEVRQFLITRPKAKRPVIRTRKPSAPIFLQSAPVANFSATMALLGRFVLYPSGLLTAYAELTAAVFHARNNLRLSNATGCLYKRGRIRKPKVEEAPNFVPFIP